MSALAQVAVARPFPHTLTYLVPEALARVVAPGVLVRVPLGTTKEYGVVVALGGEAPGKHKLRTIESIASPGFRVPEEILRLGEWVADYYLCGIGEALGAASFIGFNDITISRPLTWRLVPDWQEKLQEAKGLDAVAESIAALPEELALTSIAMIAREIGAAPARVKKLADMEVLVPAEGALPRWPHAPESPHQLTGEQQRALNSITAAMDAEEFRTFLLFGITGSGKTEVYLRAIEKALRAGRTALCLVPEIALTPQTVSRFERRFAKPIGVCHSQMTRREKRILHDHLLAGRVRLVIGARSAVFAPLPRLGIIVVDEEHEHSYKQGETPHYHARDVAIVRAQRLRIPVLLGSATPSMESFHNARAGKYDLLELKERPRGAVLPPVRVVDLAESKPPEGGFSLLSNALREAIADRLAKGEQTLLLLNRRGFSSFLFCPSCRWVPKCDEDDLAMTVHRSKSRTDAEADGVLDLFTPAQEILGRGHLRCHFCNTTAPIPAGCPKCGSLDLMAMGTGTQRVEEELADAFPAATLLRLDMDSMGGRQSFLNAWQQMLSGEAQIILGTQMIAKGLHLERVTLVGVVLAETGLFIADFRAEERTFSLLSQVAGRAGRVNAGEVLLQTFMARRACIELATTHDYPGWYEQELRRRRALRFPPIERLIAITLSDPDPQRARDAAASLAYLLHHRLRAGDGPGTAVRGPLPAPVKRLAGRFRERILLRGANPREMNRLLRTVLGSAEWKLPHSARLHVDVDPLDLL